MVIKKRKNTVFLFTLAEKIQEKQTDHPIPQTGNKKMQDFT